MSPVFSTAAKVRDFVRSLKPGDRFTTLLCAEAMGFKPRPYLTRPGFDYGPISGPLFDARMTGAVKVFEKRRQLYVYEVVDISKLDSIQDGPARMGDCREGSGEGCKHPNRLNREDFPHRFAPFAAAPPVHEAVKSMGTTDEVGYYRLKLSLTEVLASVPDEALFEELRRRIRDAGNKTSKI
jgi:hypothetical protein